MKIYWEEKGCLDNDYINAILLYLQEHGVEAELGSPNMIRATKAKGLVPRPTWTKEKGLKYVLADEFQIFVDKRERAMITTTANENNRCYCLANFELQDPESLDQLVEFFAG